MMSFRRVVVMMMVVAVSTSMMAERIRAARVNPAPRALYGTVSSYDDATKTLTLLGGSIAVDVSHARIVGKNGSDTLNPLRPGLQVSIQLEAGSRLSAWLVEQKTESPASLTGPVDQIDLGAGTFIVDGVVIRPNANTAWRGGADVRSLAELQAGQAVNVDVDGDAAGIIAQQIFVVGFIPSMIEDLWGFVTKIENDLWTITTATGDSVVIRVANTTTFNSADGIGFPGLGEFVHVTLGNASGNNPAPALVITDFPPPQQQTQFSYAVFGTLSELTANSVTITDLNNHTLTLPVDANTRFFRGAKLGDYVEVRVRVDDAMKNQIVVQVIKTNRLIRLGVTGVVQKIEGDTWTVAGYWKVIVTPQTKLINNPRLGDKVRVVGESEQGSDTIRALEIERL